MDTVAILILLAIWLCLPPLLALAAYVGYYFLSLPLRRQERARLFLDIIEFGLESGQSPEATIRSAAKSGDRALGVRFHLLARWLETGRRLDQALECVPRLLPPGVAAMLKVGLELGDVRKVIGACRQQLGEGVSKLFQAHNYLVAVLLMVSPVWVAVFAMLMVSVVPRLTAIATDMDAGFPSYFVWFADHSLALILVQVAIAIGLYLATLAYVGGPRLAGWVDSVLPGFPDWIAFKVPWRRKRMQRDFSAMLAVLLDGGVPEHSAVRMAADSTANSTFQQRANSAIASLERGSGLVAAVRHMDDSGEFGWRIENAARGSGRFMSALAGWHEALSAQAFQLEQATAQLITSGLVLVNGVFVGTLAAAVFGMLTGVLNAGVLW